VKVEMHSESRESE